MSAHISPADDNPLDAELSAYAALLARAPRRDVIPEDYDQLQSVHAIELLFKAMGPQPLPDVVAGCALGGTYLCLANLRDLISSFLRELRTLHSPRVTTSILADDFAWHAAILGIANKLLVLCELAIGEASTLSTEASPGGALPLDYIAVYESLSQSILESLSDILRKNYKNEISDKPSTRLVHSAKTVHLHQCFLYQRLAFTERWAGKKQLNLVLVENIAQRAQDELTISGHTYFSQFRLLHQIPELLGLGIAQLIGESNPTTGHVLLLAKCMEVIVACLEPLRELMTPGKYFSIRRGLGVTSGSESTTLANVVLGASMTAYLQRARDHGSDTLSIAIVEALSREWREHHLALPRHILGIGTAESAIGVKSLIGSEEAAVAVLEFFKTHERNRGQPASQANRLEFGALDSFLVSLTAQSTKDNFPDVQNRTGRYAKHDT